MPQAAVFAGLAACVTVAARRDGDFAPHDSRPRYRARSRAPLPAMPPRPSRRLSTLRLLRVAQQNSLAACDEELFDELFVERRLLGQRFFVVSDPDGIRRVLQDNLDNYPRLTWIRRMFEFVSGSGMLHAEGDPWRRHRRLINPTLDHRALLPDGPMLIELAEEMARHLALLPPGTPIDVHDAFQHLITLSAGYVFAGFDRSIDPMIDRIGQYPGAMARSMYCRRRVAAPARSLAQDPDRGGPVRAGARPADRRAP